MTREVDLREADSQRRAAGLAAAGGGAGVRVQRLNISVDAASGLVPVAGLAADGGSFSTRALLVLSQAGSALGLEPGQPPEFVVNPFPVATSSGAHSVYSAQNSQSIPIFQADQTVLFAPDGSASEVHGVVAAVPPGERSTRPTLSAVDAVVSALHHLEEGASGDPVDPFGQPQPDAPVSANAEVRVLGQFVDMPDMPTVLSCSVLEDNVTASLVWFPLNEDLVLCWRLVLTMPHGAGQYLVLVDARSGDITYSTQLSRGIMATAQVYLTDPSQPRQQVTMPLPLERYGLGVPSGLPGSFPYDWVEATGSEGPDVIAHTNDADPVVNGTTGSSVTFAPTDPVGLDQCVLNAFYSTCFMHDFLYLLGFREADGNFQSDDFGLGGAASDRVDVRVYPHPIWATANMSTPVDGMSPTLRLGSVQETGRHTALDSSVIFHETTHGLTNRLVGGALNVNALVQPQSAAMGEGWSDFVSCQIRNSDVVGAWVVNSPGGIRGFPYDDRFPATFADVGTGRYVEMHAVGEIWCAMLMSLARAIGSSRALSLVVDSLKLMPANPSMLDARDAMLSALGNDLAAGVLSAAQHDTEVRAAWKVFAAGGLGPAAASSGASLSGVVADFTLPASARPAWGAWAATGPGAVSASASIAVVGSAGSAAELFVVGSDGRVYSSSRSGQAWGAWAVSGPGAVPASASIAVLGAAGSAAELFVVGADGRLYASGLPAA